jgi:Beta-propeller repeat
MLQQWYRQLVTSTRSRPTVPARSRPAVEQLEDRSLPSLTFSTYLGGTDFGPGSAVAVAAAGNTYVAGYTDAANFPTTAGALQRTFGGGSDAFVAKFGPDGTLLYSTLLGGNGLDRATGIAVDAAGDACVTGWTLSNDFPTQNAGQTTRASGLSDAFVAKLNPTGSALLYSTFFGGSGADQANAIAVDAAGNAYVTGSTDLPTLNAAQPTFGGGTQDAFVARFGPTGTLLTATYLGGSGDDVANGIAVDGAGNVFVAGTTGSRDFPTQNALQAGFGGGNQFTGTDAFLTKLNAGTLAVEYSTYLGGSGDEKGNAVAVDAAGNAYVTGGTNSTDFPTAGAYQPNLAGFANAFVTKVSATGGLVYSTYLGGEQTDVGRGIAVDSAGNAFVTGYTISSQFPVANAVQGTYTGLQDAFVTEVNAAGSGLVYSTYLAGSAFNEGDAIAVDGSGVAHVTGSTGSPDFPTANAAQGSTGDPGPNGANAFVAVVVPSAAAPPAAVPPASEPPALPIPTGGGQPGHAKRRHHHRRPAHKPSRHHRPSGTLGQANHP